MGKTNKALFSSYLYGIPYNLDKRFNMSSEIAIFIAYGFDIFNHKAIVTL